MNPKFLKWFTNGHVADALCGFDEFFVDDITYRSEHDYVLAIGELLAWAKAGHHDMASRGLVEAVARLMSRKQLRPALRLVRTYGLLAREIGTTLPLDEHDLLKPLASGINEAAGDTARDPSLRALVLSVADEFPTLNSMLGLK